MGALFLIRICSKSKVQSAALDGQDLGKPYIPNLFSTVTSSRPTDVEMEHLKFNVR